MNANKDILKQTLCLVLFFCVIFLSFTDDQLIAKENHELVFYNWTAYVDDGVIENFEKTRNIKIRQEYFQSSDERDEIIMNKNGKGYDVVMINGNDVVPYARKGWIVPLGVKKIPNLSQMNEKWVNAWPDTNKYAVPYLWGTLGIIYRSDLIDENITSWKQFYSPKEAWRNKIMLVDIHRLGIGMALKSLGYSLNSENPKAVDAAIKLLEKQHPYVQTYGYLKTDADSGIVSGKTWLGQTWNGDALLLQKRNPAIRYVLPKEGGEIWVDYMVVLKSSKIPEIAIDFINYLSEAKNSTKAALKLRFATPNIKARKYLPAKFLNNPVIYPPKDALSASEPTMNINPRIKKKMVEAWTRITR